jgi:transporter family-2 protein
MLSRLVFGGLMVAVGVLAAMQPPINAALARRTGVLPATTVSFIVGALVLLVLSLLMRQAGGFAGVRDAAWWQLTGGLIGAVFVFATVLFLPRLGAAGLVATLLTGQLAGGMLIDRLGLFGLPQTALSPLRLMGLALLIAGGLLVIQR